MLGARDTSELLSARKTRSDAPEKAVSRAQCVLLKVTRTLGEIAVRMGDPPLTSFRLRLELRTYCRTLGSRSLEAAVAAENASALIGSSRAINRAISAKPSSNGAAVGWGGSER